MRIWLCGVKVPPRGGETLFASAAAAVEALPAEQLALLESLDCEHRCTALPCNTDALAIFHLGFSKVLFLYS